LIQAAHCAGASFVEFPVQLVARRGAAVAAPRAAKVAAAAMNPLMAAAWMSIFQGP
jgi:hypothetical protein